MYSNAFFIYKKLRWNTMFITADFVIFLMKLSYFTSVTKCYGASMFYTMATSANVEKGNLLE